MASANASACGPSLTNDTYHTRCETQCAALRFYDPEPVHCKAIDGEGPYAGAGLVAGTNASALARPSLTIHTWYVTHRRTQRTMYVTTPLCRRTRKHSIVGNYGMCRCTAWSRRRSVDFRPCPSLTILIIHVASSIAIYIIHVVKPNVLLYVPTSLGRYPIKQSMEREDMPVHVSWPAPTRRPAVRLSLTNTYPTRCETQ